MLEIEVKVASLSRQHSTVHGSATLPDVIVAADLQENMNASLKTRKRCRSLALHRHQRGASQHKA